MHSSPPLHHLIALPSTSSVRPPYTFVDASATQSNTQYRSRIRTEPTNLTAPQWTAALWTRLESMIEEMAGCCIKVRNWAFIGMALVNGR